MTIADASPRRRTRRASSRGSARLLVALGAMLLAGRATPAAAVPRVIGGTTAGLPGDRVSVDVRLDAGGATTSSMQNDLAYDPSIVTVARTALGDPDCTV